MLTEAPSLARAGVLGVHNTNDQAQTQRHDGGSSPSGIRHVPMHWHVGQDGGKTARKLVPNRISLQSGPTHTCSWTHTQTASENR